MLDFDAGAEMKLSDSNLQVNTPLGIFLILDSSVT
jgi:hypothetical protein